MAFVSDAWAARAAIISLLILSFCGIHDIGREFITSQEFWKISVGIIFIMFLSSFLSIIYYKKNLNKLP